MKQIFGLYKAQAVQFLRNRSSVLTILLLPVAFGAFFGLIFSGSGQTTLHMGIANEDRGAAGAQFVANLLKSVDPKVIDLQTGNRTELLALLNKAKLQVVMVLPEDMTTAMTDGKMASITAYYDPKRVDSVIALNTVRTIIYEANLSITKSPRLLVIDEQTVQVQQVRQVDYYMPGMLGVALLWLGVFGTALPVVVQREGQIYRRFSVTPLSRLHVLAAEVSWRVTVGLMQTAIFLLVGWLGFGVKVVKVLPFAGAIMLGTLVFVSLGYLLCGLGRTSESVTGIGQIVQFPMMMLSGAFFPLDMLPGIFKSIAAAMPLTYLNDLLHQTMTGLPPVYPMGLDFAILGAWLVVLTLLAAKLWRWE